MQCWIGKAATVEPLTIDLTTEDIIADLEHGFFDEIAEERVSDEATR